MNDLSLHIFDIVQNSIDADATHIFITISQSECTKVTVSDNGHGMSNSVLDRAGELGFTTRATGRGGMGLALLSHAAEQITITSTPGIGTIIAATFSLEFPLGDMGNTLLALTHCYPKISIIYRREYKHGVQLYDTRILRRNIKFELNGEITMKTLDELNEIRERMRPDILLRKEDRASTRIIVCMGTCGIQAGAREVLADLVKEVNARAIEDIMVTQTGCIGMCDLEPIVLVQTPRGGGTIYVNMTPEKAIEVIEEHIINHRVIEKYTRKNA